MASVREIDGVWKIELDGRAVAIHSRDPHREADVAVTRLVGAESPALIVAIGLGLGYLLEALDRATWTGKVLALEPEPATVDSLLARPVAQQWTSDGRLRVLTAPAFDGASDCWSLFGDGRAEPAIFINPAVARLYPEAVAAARSLAARLQAEAASNALARHTFGARYLLNTLRNLPAIAADGNVADLFGKAPGLPALLIAAGPSLDRALPALRQAQNAALFICVDTALRPLLAAGIRPHLVVSVDPSEANARHLADVPPCPETFLAAEGSLDPLAIAPFWGRTFFFNVSDHQPWPWLEQQGHGVGRLRAWGSVLTSAFDLALKIGCNPIVFAGADLAYTDDRPYCRGVVFEEDWQRHAEWGVPHQQQWSEAIDRYPAVFEADVDGRPARTAPHLLAFRNWLLEQMRRERGRRFFNATGGGILCGDGIEQVALDSLPSVLSSLPIDAEIVRAHHHPRQTQVLAAARSLARDLEVNEPRSLAVLASLEAFAPKATRGDILDVLHRLDAGAHRRMTAPESFPTMLARVSFVDSWLRPWANTVPLAPLRIPPHRITEWSGTGARIFFFRTMAARLILCSLEPRDGGLLEDGRPLKQADSIEHVVDGTYRTNKDELHFRSSDGTDPRWNGREYVLMVPPVVAALEAMPLHEILERRL